MSATKKQNQLRKQSLNSNADSVKSAAEIDDASQNNDQQAGNIPESLKQVFANKKIMKEKEATKLKNSAKHICDMGNTQACTE